MFTVILALTLAADVDPEPPGVAVKILTSTVWTPLKSLQQVERHAVARSVEGLIGREKGSLDPKEVLEYTEVVARDRFGVKAIDWGKQMVVVVAAGRQDTSGFRVEVKEVSLRGKTLKVIWRLDEKGKIGGASVSYPATAILVPMHKGKVVFVQAK